MTPGGPAVSCLVADLPRTERGCLSDGRVIDLPEDECQVEGNHQRRIQSPAALRRCLDQMISVRALLHPEWNEHAQQSLDKVVTSRVRTPRRSPLNQTHRATRPE